MSDYKPITGELRDAMHPWGWVETDGSIMFTTSPIPSSIDAEQSLAISGSDFDRLCDAIDAVHAQLERENAALKAELDRVLGEQERAMAAAALIAGVPMTDENMAEHGWVRGPLDKDGKMWRSGDMSDSNWGVIEGIAYSNGRWLVRGHDMSAPWIPADSIRHYHAPTVEDVLREFTDAVFEWAGKSGTVAEVGTWSDVAAQYAAKLQLAGDAE